MKLPSSIESVFLAALTVSRLLSFGIAQEKRLTECGRCLLKVGVIAKGDSFDGAGCSLWMPSDAKKRRAVFLSDFDGSAVINIDGKDIELKLINRREPKGGPKKGDRSTWNYAAKNVSARVDYVVTRVCDPNDEACEVTWYDATIAVASGKRKRVVKVTGICGS